MVPIKGVSGWSMDDGISNVFESEFRRTRLADDDESGLFNCLDKMTGAGSDIIPQQLRA